MKHYAIETIGNGTNTRYCVKQIFNSGTAPAIYKTFRTVKQALEAASIAGEEAGSDIIKGMYLQSISDSSSGNFGISDMLYNFLSQNNKKEQG